MVNEQALAVLISAVVNVHCQMFAEQTLNTLKQHHRHIRLIFSKPDIEIPGGSEKGRKISAREIKMVDVHQPIWQS